MKRIFFWATVDIFWVMESWVTKKLLGPNGRAKTQFSPSSYIFVAGRRMQSDLKVEEENHNFIVVEIISSFSYNN